MFTFSFKLCIQEWVFRALFTVKDFCFVNNTVIIESGKFDYVWISSSKCLKYDWSCIEWIESLLFSERKKLTWVLIQLFASLYAACT